MDWETLFYIVVVIILYIILYISFFRYFYIKSNLLIPPIETFINKQQPDRYYYYKLKRYRR
jgi:hypothetical protein